MDFVHTRFLVFLAAVAILWRFVPPRWRTVLLFAASYYFYCSANPKKSLILLSATVGGFMAAKAMSSIRFAEYKRLIMAGFVAGMVGLIVVFKGNAAWHVLPGTILMPLGFSYYTFKLISYVVDVYWGSLAPESSFVSFASYVAFFPQIVAGPIQRAGSFLDAIRKPLAPDSDRIVLAIQRILLGLFKKFLIADSLGMLVNPVYDAATAPGTPLIAAFYLYPLQLYADFSGLTDIAVGAAGLLGIESPENFNVPFWAVNLSDFWRRWHMSLTTWLTDYVFTPLHMATRSLGNAGLVLSLMVNMLLIGLWHGFRLTFAVFGLIHALYLSVDALTARARRRYYKGHPGIDRATNWIGPVVTFHLVALALVFFRSLRVTDALYFLRSMWSIPAQWSAEFVHIFVRYGRGILLSLAAFVLAEVWEFFCRRKGQSQAIAQWPRWGRWALYACTATSVVFVILLYWTNGGERNPFVYAVF